MADNRKPIDDTASDELNEAHQHAEPKGEGAGEDEGSAPIEGNDDHLKDDQKPITH